MTATGSPTGLTPPQPPEPQPGAGAGPGAAGDASPDRGPVAASAGAPGPDHRPHLRIGGRSIPVVLPNRRDPRLRLSAVIMTLQVLGQTVLEWKVSIAQILVSIGVCAAIEATVTFRQQGILAWPASAILTGNSVAFILRASGTQHGDWWSLNGVHFFVLAAVLSLLSKYLIRPGGRHLFNPSNVGLVWCLLVIGPRYVFPQYLWWGPLELPVILALVVIFAGGAWVLRAVHMGVMALAFLGTFAVLVAGLALLGRSFVAVWSEPAITGIAYWVHICLSPELLIFVFFMVSDPQTAPKAARGRVVYGAAIAVVAAALIAPQQTEFGIKLAILSSLTVVCALVPAIESIAQRRERARVSAASAASAAAIADGGDAPPPPPPVPVPLTRRLALAARNPVLVAAAVIAVAAPVNTTALAGDEQLVNIERRLTSAGEAQ